ncbi:gram-negative bacteria-binding protein 1-like isoform X2 [Contarinia nasturtii]|uniref:gram-negative bacteria-binding protein 1-like isoform X2 n=1 Tax=Contarinia nasturtii TaxID=265458 RepID=UPI0012D455C9|nr:gram-negative bacteria-binding protein 1-like isoform X2 [Contarinia nasturtii]
MGLWSYENNQYQLRQGDVLNFWIYVQHGRFGYSLQNQRYIYPDHFVYNSEFSNFGGSNGSKETNDEVWNSSQKVPTTTQVYEEPNMYASRYTTKATSSSNYWTTTTQHPIHINHYNQQNNNQNQYNQQNEYNQQQQSHQQNEPNPLNQQNYENCHPSITTVNKKHISCKDTLIFEEQFNRGSLLDRWSQDVRMPLEIEDAEFVIYHSYSSVWNVSQGSLNIFPKLLYRIQESGFSEADIRTGHFLIDSKECTSFIDPKEECERHAGLKRILPPVVSAKFRSKKTFNFQYGKVEIRAKLPKGDWIFPQIYLEPTENRYRGVGEMPYLNGQLRIAFIHGNDILEKSDVGYSRWHPSGKNYLWKDGKILIGICVISGGDTVREVARKSVSANFK